MSRRSKKQKQREKNAENKKQAADKGPAKPDAMEQAMRNALTAKGEELPERSSKSFSQSLEDLGKKIFGTVRPTDIPIRTPRPRGADTQFLKKSYSGDVELVVGLDFGTACTKVVIQDVATRTAFAVPFANGSDSMGTYLLPTIVSLDDHDNFNLDRRGTEFRGLKENLMSIAAADSSGQVAGRKDLMPHTIAYLALTFREVRAWFMEEHEEDYKGREILWRVNVGLPATRYDQQHLPELYKSTFRRAWYLSALNCQINAKTAVAVRMQNNIPKDGVETLSANVLETFPEVVAAVQGYAKSPERTEGIHILVDVGATTLDVTCFRLHKHDHDDQYPIFFASVRRLGGFELFKHRAAVVTNQVNHEISLYEANLDGVTEPENPLEIQFGLGEEEKISINNEFENEVGMAIWNVIAETKNRREPSASEWTTSLPVFMCGGASAIDLYDQALIRIDENSSWQGSLDRKELILPRNVQAPGITPGVRQRLMVAYGLSFNQLDFGHLIPPSGIPDAEPLEGREQRGNPFTTKEMT